MIAIHVMYALMNGIILNIAANVKDILNIDMKW